MWRKEFQLEPKSILCLCMYSHVNGMYKKRVPSSLSDHRVLGDRSILKGDRQVGGQNCFKDGGSGGKGLWMLPNPLSQGWGSFSVECNNPMCYGSNICCPEEPLGPGPSILQFLQEEEIALSSELMGWVVATATVMLSLDISRILKEDYSIQKRE